MPLTRLPADLPDRFRAAGLEVVPIPGWETRGRPASTGRLNAVGNLWHHTGSRDVIGDPKDDREYAEWLATVGRSDLPAPLCHGSISLEGVVYLCAAGRANHAGVARASGSVASGDGNELYIGWECMNDGSQGFGGPQYAAMVTVGAVMMDVLGTSEQAQRAHRETSVTGKWDPGLVNMDDFRDDIAARHGELHARPVPPRVQPRAEKLLTECDDFLRRLAQAGKGGPDLTAVLDKHPGIADRVTALRADLRKLTADN